MPYFYFPQKNVLVSDINVQTSSFYFHTHLTSLFHIIAQSFKDSSLHLTILCHEYHSVSIYNYYVLT